jgi:leucyl-tRNA synthetase
LFDYLNAEILLTINFQEERALMSFRFRTDGQVKFIYRKTIWIIILLLACFIPAIALSATPGMGEAVEKVPETAAEKAAAQATEKAVEKAVEKVTEKAIEKATEDAAAKAAEKVTEKAVEKALEKVTGDAAAISTLTAKRPEAWKGPTKIEFLIFVLDVDAIDDAQQNFTANVYMQMHWHDDRLESQESAIRQVPLSKVWNPQVIIANRVGLVSKSLPDVVQVFPDGKVVYQQRYTGKFSQPLKLFQFPMDKHTFMIQFVATGDASEDLEFVPGGGRNKDVFGGAIADELSLPDWEIIGSEALALPYRPIEQVNAPGFAFRFEARRYFSYYLWQIVLPLTVVVFMSWAAFWIKRSETGVRIAVATSSVLTLIAHRFVLASLLPRLPYMTRMDYFTVGSTLLVFLALLTVVFTSFFDPEECSDCTARRINIGSRFAFPIVFFVLMWWFIAV